MTPKKITKAQLLELLDNMKQMVGADDSFEGFIQYTGMEDGLAADEFNVVANMRVGNSQGQGGYLTVGEFGEESS
jgi:hypothetical protein